MINLIFEGMNNTKIILYDCLYIYKILEELNDILKLNLVNFENKRDLTKYIEINKNYLVIKTGKDQDYKNQIILDDLPLKIEKVIEKINLAILKNNFSLKSNIKIGRYILNLNSREISFKKKVLKLTEQEVKILTYLDKFKEPTKVEKLQKEIWGYKEDLETHTVETHIHRLRKKFENTFEDRNIILSAQKGYIIKY